MSFSTITTALRSPALLFAFVGGVFQFLAFPSANITVLSLVSLALLLFALRDSKSLKTSFLYGYVWGLAFFGGLIYWIVGTVHTYGKLPLAVAFLAYILLIGFLALYPALFALFADWFGRKQLSQKQGTANSLLSLFVLPSAWVVLEQVRGTFPFGGFPWGNIGYSWVGVLEWTQIAEFTSVHGVAWLIVFLNVLLFLAATSFLESRKKEAIAYGTAFLLVLAGNHLLGTFLMKREAARPAESSVKVALLQGNIAQDIKWNKQFRDETLQTYFRLQAEGAGKGATLIVWPETSAPLYLLKSPDFLSLFYRQSELENVSLIVGVPDYIERKQKGGFPVTNTALFFKPGEASLERYDKIHLVPFGEYVPLQDWLPFIGKLVEEVGNFAAGSGPKLFQNEGYRIAPFICFEVIFPEEVREGVLTGANLITHITNDAWFGDSSAPHQHVQIVQMRSIENRVPSITAANTGVSDVILSTGEIAAKTEMLQETALVEDVGLRSFSPTFYGRNGNLFLYFCILVLGVGVFFMLRKVPQQ